MIDEDYYGSKTKWFIGVVKDINDPLNSNRVRVRIKGIHPEDPLGDIVSSTSTVTGETSSGGGGGTGGAVSQSGTQSNNTYPPIQSQSLIQIDRSTLPKNTQLAGKLSKNYTLGDLTTKTAVSGPSCVRQMPNCSDSIIYNLANLSTNVLDPLKDQFPNMIITSGWRPNNGSNHGPGYAADIQLPGRRARQLGDWIVANLKGRFSMMIWEPTWIHIQLGGKGSTENPIITSMLGGTKQ